MTEQLRSVLLGTAVLSIAVIIALILTFVRHAIDANAIRLQATVRLAGVAIVLQAAHFTEEFATDFGQRFPELLGLMPWSRLFFVSFNVFWLTMFALSLWGLRARRRVALFPLWFLGLASVGNGLAHPLFAVQVRGYFPGLVTAPFVGIIGILLLRRLLLVTGERKYTMAAA
jgi:hypothetical protein